MSIQTYQTEIGETRFQVYVNVRSKENLTVRIQKRSKGFKTEAEARREESKLLREAEREVLGKESLGSSWGNVVDHWETHLTTERGDSLNEVTRGDYIAALRKHTERFWPFPAS